MRFVTIIFAILICLFYYTVGGDSFPDYSNYITISEKGGWLFDPNEYYFEWVARWWLREVPLYLSSNYTVDLLALFVQILYIYWIANNSDKSGVEAKYWIAVLSGPLFLTTTLRGTVAYIAAFYLVDAKRTSSLSTFACIMLGLSFHDSFFIVATAYILALICHHWLGKKMMVAIYLFSVLMIIFGSELFGGLVSLILVVGIGIRDVYFSEVSSPSLVKIIYALLVAIMVFPIVIAKKSERSTDASFLIIMLAASSILFALSSTPAIRMLLYVSGVALIVGFKNQFYPRFFSSPGIMIAFGVPLICLMFWDLFRNAAI